VLFDIFNAAGTQIIYRKHLMTVTNQPVSKMRADKTRTARNQYIHIMT
jgi:hypothetical protein